MKGQHPTNLTAFSVTWVNGTTAQIQTAFTSPIQRLDTSATSATYSENDTVIKFSSVDEATKYVNDQATGYYLMSIFEVSMSETIGRLSAKYRVSKRDLWEDWQKRIQWVYDVFDLELAQAPRSTYAMTYATVAEYPLISQSVAPRSCRTETQE
ncbi:MAG: hypothetical protein WAL97_02830 [Halobacteriota archaeon]